MELALDRPAHLAYELGISELEGERIMPLHVKSSDVKEYQRDQSGEAGTGRMVVRKAHGNECSLMIAT